MDAQAPAQSYPYSYLHLYLHLYPYPDSTLYLGHWYDHGGVLGHQLALVPGDSHLVEAVEAVEVVEAVEEVEAAVAPSAFAFTQPQAEVAAAAAAAAEAQAAPSAFAFTQPPAVNDEAPDDVAAAVQEAVMEKPMGTATEAADISAAASGGNDTGASRLAALRNRLEEAEDQMQTAVDDDDFEAASELQEVVDALTDEIDQLEASL